MVGFIASPLHTSDPSLPPSLHPHLPLYVGGACGGGLITAIQWLLCCCAGVAPLHVVSCRAGFSRSNPYVLDRDLVIRSASPTALGQMDFQFLTRKVLLAQNVTLKLERLVLRNINKLGGFGLDFFMVRGAEGAEGGRGGQRAPYTNLVCSVRACASQGVVWDDQQPVGSSNTADSRCQLWWAQSKCCQGHVGLLPLCVWDSSLPPSVCRCTVFLTLCSKASCGLLVLSSKFPTSTHLCVCGCIARLHLPPPTPPPAPHSHTPISHTHTSPLVAGR